MPNLDFIPPGPNASAPRDREPLSPLSGSPSAHERFDAVMRRLLSRASHYPSDSRTSARSAAKRKADRADDAANSPNARQTALAGAAAAIPTTAPTRDSAGEKTGANAATDSVAEVQTATETNSIDAEQNPGQSATAGAAPGESAAGTSGLGALLDLVPGNSDSAPATVGPGDDAAADLAADGESGSAAELKNDLKLSSGTAPIGKVISAKLAEAKLAAAETSSDISGSGPSPPAADPRGISVAQMDAPMQKAVKTHENAGLPEQKLPVGSPSFPSGVTNGGGDPSVAAPSHAVGLERSAEMISLTDASATALRSVERAHDLIAAHVTRLRDSGLETLHVVIKPDAGLQLSLDLHLRGKAIEVQATLDRGDFNFLSRHWTELQQQLEPRGIRLAPLTQDAQTAGQGTENFERSERRSSGEDSIQNGAFDRPAIAGLAHRAPVASRTKTSRNWESWA